VLVEAVTGVYHVGTRPQPFLVGDAVMVLNFAAVSANYFDVLGMRPVVGRLFRPEDGQTGAPLVIVLSYAAWRRSFGRTSTARRFATARSTASSTRSATHRRTSRTRRLSAAPSSCR
jgi:hypothetical protein